MSTAFFTLDEVLAIHAHQIAGGRTSKADAAVFLREHASQD